MQSIVIPKQMTNYHPHLNSKGQRVLLAQPDTGTPLSTWLNRDTIATVVPQGCVPDVLNGTAFTTWNDVPRSDEGWNNVPGQYLHDEPTFAIPEGKRPAAGVVIEEADGRIWLVSPSNAFGGYKTTLPKGGVDVGVSLQACAIREAFEEAGLKVHITGWLADSNRCRSYTRYYRAIRTGGTPTDMGWESQSVHLVPRSALHMFLTHPNDLPLLQAILQATVDNP